MNTWITAAAIIVIIAIVLVAAYAIMYGPTTSSTTTTSTVTPAKVNSTGLTNVGTPPPRPGCTSSNSFGCANASITMAGLLSLSLTSQLNMTLYNIHIACIAYNSSIHRPVNVSSWYALTNLGTTKPFNFTGTSIPPKGVENIASLQCYNASGSPTSLGMNQAYLGLVLVNYTNSATIVNSSTRLTSAGAVEINIQAKQTV